MVNLKHVHIMLIFVLLAMLVTPVLAQDPTGAETLEGDPNAPVNFAWTLICGFLVMFMQAGFAMVETGLTRAKNASNIMMKNLADFSFGALSYWAVGFALMFGTASGITGLLFGTDGFFLLGDAYDVSTIELWFFQMVFAATAATIVSGAVAERVKFSTYLIASIAITALIYPIYGHWLWGGGWLNTADFMVNLGGGYGALDFAGSGVVHAVGGFIGLAGALLLGPRIGKFRKDGTPVAIPGHALTLAALGVFILWFGWFGFNPGSTTTADGTIGYIAVNTSLAACAGSIGAMIMAWLKFGKPDTSMTLNGVLAGLVAITAGCYEVSPVGSIIIGFMAGFLVVLSVEFIDKVLHIDDPVGAVSVHGVCGAFGTLMVGLFAAPGYGSSLGLFYGGSASLLLVQLLGVAVVGAWAFGTGLVMFKIIKGLFGLRVSEVEELKGLDISEHGSESYNGFQIFTTE